MSLAVTFATRYLLVCLFFPFSALDKIINFDGAVCQAREAVGNRVLAVAMILIGLGVEIAMPICILSGTADRMAGLVLAGYCAVTALLWKQWWRPDDFWKAGESRARSLFWDFLKNLSLAGGFLLLAFGLHQDDVGHFVQDPFGSSKPYNQAFTPS